ncbi:MAG TPA: DUF6549 family protein [Bacteroidales bacterium]
MKEKALATFIFLFVCFVGFEYAKMYYREKREKDRLQNSFATANETIKYYKTRNGLLVAQTTNMQLRYDELKQIFPKVIDEIKNLDIKPKQVTQYSETVVKSEKQIVTHLKDSIIRDTIRARVFNYQDSFYTVKGIAVGDTQQVRITSVDSLIQVVYKGERYRPWLWIFSRRKLQQAITSKNPNNKIMYSKTIQISRP